MRVCGTGTLGDGSWEHVGYGDVRCESARDRDALRRLWDRVGLSAKLMLHFCVCSVLRLSGRLRVQGFASDRECCVLGGARLPLQEV